MAQKINDAEEDLLMDFKTECYSTETESDEDEFVTRKIALQEPKFSAEYMAKGVKQSTLPGSGSRVFYETKGWNLLKAAAEEVDKTVAFYSNKIFAPTLKPVSVPHQNPNPESRFKPEMGPSYQPTQLQQMMKNGVREQAKMGPYLSMAAWPTIQQSQQQPGSGLRAVFLKERTGTGVFLPRRFEPNPTTELIRNKKSAAAAGCSVLLPDIVVHALNLNLDSMDSSTSHHHRSITTNMTPQQYDAAFKLRNNLRTKLPVMNQELRLPQEWTY